LVAALILTLILLPSCGKSTADVPIATRSLSDDAQTPKAATPIPDEDKDPKYTLNPTLDADSPTGFYIPGDLEDCFSELDKMLHPDLILEIKRGSESDMIQFHFGLGMWIRNNWGLWQGSVLGEYFNALGIYHPDDISGIILDSYWHYLNDEPIELDEQVNYYKEYWKKQNQVETDPTRPVGEGDPTRPVGKVEPIPEGCLYMEFFSPSDNSAYQRDQSGRISAVITPVRIEPLLKQWTLEEFEEAVYNADESSLSRRHLPGVAAWEYLEGYLRPEDEIWTFGVLDTGFMIIRDGSVFCVVVTDHAM
jgi:hypothetical protein